MLHLSIWSSRRIWLSFDLVFAMTIGKFAMSMFRTLAVGHEIVFLTGRRPLLTRGRNGNNSSITTTVDLSSKIIFINAPNHVSRRTPRRASADVALVAFMWNWRTTIRLSHPRKSWNTAQDGHVPSKPTSFAFHKKLTRTLPWKKPRTSCRTSYRCNAITLLRAAAIQWHRLPSDATWTSSTWVVALPRKIWSFWARA